MADKRATATGNWSAITWFPPGLPGVNDDVYSNGFTVTIDNNYEVKSIRNVALQGFASAGGSFTLNSGITFKAYVYGGGVTDVACLNFSAVSPARSTLVGSLCAGDPNALVLRPRAISNNSSGHLVVLGNGDGVINSRTADPGASNSANGYISNNSTGILTLCGSYYFSDIGGASSGTVAQFGIRNENSSGTTNIRGIVYGGQGNFSYGIYNSNNGVVAITGRLVGGGPGSNTVGLQNWAAGRVFVLGDIIGGISSSGHGYAANGTGSLRVVGDVLANVGCGIFSGNDNLITITGNVSGSLSNHGIDLSTRLRNVVIVNGDVKAGGGSSCHGINTTGGTCQIYVKNAVGNGFGIFSAGNVLDRAVGNSFAINNSQSSTLVGVQNITCGIRGNFPTTGVVFLTAFDNNTGEFFQFRRPNLQTLTFLRAQTFANYVPAENDVRLGVRYAGYVPEVLTPTGSAGRLAMPLADAVIFGVPVDDTTGVGFLCAADAWGVPVSGLTTKGSMGVLAKNCLTINSLSALIVSLNS
jgi:hypothetical protein